jgi:hypothetical protein
MATSFDVVEDLGLTVIADYKIEKLFTQQGQQQFKAYCDIFLMNAINNFIDCKQDLTYNLLNRTFDEDLTSLEISILADYWGIAWMTRNVQDATQISLKLSTTGGFETHSEAQNLKEKSSWLDRLRERVEQKITQYQLLDFSGYEI